MMGASLLQRRSGARHPAAQWRLAAHMGRAVPVRGRGAVALWCHAHQRHLSRVWHLRMESGHSMILPTGSSQTWLAAFTGNYDAAAIALISTLIRPRSLVIDIGASLGLYTVPLAICAREMDSTVVSFEPIPANVHYLHENIAINDLNRVVDVRMVALGSKSGRLVMRAEGAGAGNAAIVTGLSEVAEAVHRQQGALGAQIEVRADTLDGEMSSDERSCSVIKLDVEGYEMDVLAGAEGYIQTHKPAIIGEFSEGWLRARDVEWPGALWLWVTRMDYRVYELACERKRWCREASHARLRQMCNGESPRGELLLLPPGAADEFDLRMRT
jgi:FkbM family methyltransferase